MFDRPVLALDATPLGVDVPLEAVRTLLYLVDDFAIAGQGHAATQQEFLAFSPLSLAERYAAANSITRRRFDAILREAETIARTGVALIVGRDGRPERSTAAAARFLGKSVAASLRRLDGLLAPQTA